MAVDSTSRIAQAQSAAAKAEKEAAERVTQAQKHVREAAQDEEKKIEVIRDQYERRTEAERARGESYIEAVRNRNYEAIADLRRRTESEEYRIAQKAEREKAQLQSHFTESQREIEKKGEQNIQELVKKNYQHQEYERARGEEQVELLKNEFQAQKSQIEAERRDTTSLLTQKTQEHRKQLETQNRAAIEESTAHYERSYGAAMKQSREAMADLNWRASKDVEALKKDTTRKLNAYSSQKSDPFYQMVNIGGELKEREDYFEFTARIPEHERDRININVRGNELIVSGKRKSEEALEVEPGRVQWTSAYQSFSESFPLSWPVDPKRMTREFDGDRLVVRIAKKSTYEPARPKTAPEKAKLERPAFPKNLPNESQLAQLNDPGRGPEAYQETLPPSRRKTAGKTLT